MTEISGVHPVLVPNNDPKGPPDNRPPNKPNTPTKPNVPPPPKKGMSRASKRAYQLRGATIQMVVRYGDSKLLLAFAVGAAAPAEVERLKRACRRRFMAIQRLTAALRDLEVSR